MLTYTDTQKTSLLYRNARQLLTTLQATFPSFIFTEESSDTNCKLNAASDIEKAQCLWSEIHQLLRDTNEDSAFSTISSALQNFSETVQSVMSSTASNYDVPRLGLGLFITTTAALLTLPTVYRQCEQSNHSGWFLALMVIGYGAMMFASSYVEEEQQFWYWICSGWWFFLHVRSSSSRSSSPKGFSAFVSTIIGTLGLLVTQRILRRWNQTGQKFTADPDIARNFFSSTPSVMWTLVALTYVDSSHRLFQSLPRNMLSFLAAFLLPCLALLFKLNFVANDSPELLADSFLSALTEKWPSQLSLVWQARAVFAGLACCFLIAVLGRNHLKSRKGEFAAASNCVYHALY